jgi:CheY-like chemotaxis protein
MAKPIILFADNDQDFLETRTEFLEKEGYYVIPATDPTQALRVLERGEIDLAILDIRLRDDDDEKDTSGLTLAKEKTVRLVPKIILTGFPSVEAVREALKPQLDGLPAAVEFLSKEEGPDVLVWAVRRALGPGVRWLRKVKEAVEGTDNKLKEDHDNAQRQSNAYYWASLGVAVAGVVMIFLGIGLVFWNRLGIGVASTVGGIVTEAVSYLFFRRVDVANERMDRYHRERVEGRWFQTLLQACDGLDSEQNRGRCREQVIMAASGRWLGMSGGDKSRLVTIGEEEAEEGGK